jgi:hypothetical protein
MGLLTRGVWVLRARWGLVALWLSHSENVVSLGEVGIAVGNGESLGEVGIAVGNGESLGTERRLAYRRLWVPEKGSPPHPAYSA